MNWVVVLIGVACGRDQDAKFLSVVKYLIDCTIVSAIKEVLVINIARRTVLALAEIKVEIHSA